MLTKIVITVFLICPFFLLAQNQPHTILWEVSKPGSTCKSYLFGTFHEINAAFFSSLINSVQKLHQAETVYVEQTDEDAGKALIDSNAVFFWNEEKWKMLLPENEQKVFAAFVEKSENKEYYTMPPLVLRLAVFRLYAQNFCDTLYRESGELMDTYIERTALASNKKVFSLDENHLATLDSSHQKKGAREADNAIACINLMRKMLENDASECSFVAQYKQFDINYQFEWESQILNNTLDLLERNNKWVGILNKAFGTGSCFVAVGFRHLMYKQGLVQQLKKSGYQVKPVSCR